MSIPDLSDVLLGATTAIAKVGSDPGPEAEELHRTGGLLARFAGDGGLPSVELRIPRTIAVAADATEAEIVAALAAFHGPIRIAGEGRERIYPQPPDDGVEFRRDHLPGRGTVLIQEIAGSTHGNRYYPDLSGVISTNNYYPVSYMKPDEGIAYVSLGLGFGNRASMRAVRFSPPYPELMPDFSMPEDIVKNSQRMFFAVDLAESGGGKPAEFDLDTAMSDGTLAHVGGVYSHENQMVYPGVYRKGMKVVTFSALLRGNDFPLANVAKAVVEFLRGISEDPMSVEFAVVLGSGDEPHRLITERIIRGSPPGPDEERLPVEDLDKLMPHAICTSTAALGNGIFHGVRDILAVCPDRLDRARTHEIATEVGKFNEQLAQANRPYILIGSGRWGTTDKYLGIPVSWHQISGARIQIEAGLEEFNIESSRGSHFFRELTFRDIGAMHISLEHPGDHIDWKWLEGAPTTAEGEFVRHLSFVQDLDVRIDGRTGRGAILKPGPGGD